MQIPRIGPILLTFVFFFVSCKRESADHSPLFKKIFEPNTGQFRAVSLGMSIDSIKLMEHSNLKHSDLYGLAYDIELAEEKRLRIEFFLPFELTESLDQGIISIIANIDLQSEIETTALYNEMEKYLTQKYGVPEGVFGSWEWDYEEESLGVNLTLQGKKAITLNYYNL